MYKYFNVNSTLLQKAETSIFYCIFIRDWILFSKLVSISIFCYSFFSSFSLFQNMPSPIIILLSILQPTSKQILFFFYSFDDLPKRYPALSRIEVKNNESDNENTKKKEKKGEKFQRKGSPMVGSKWFLACIEQPGQRKSVPIGLSCITSRPFRSIVKRQQESNSSNCLSS